MRRPSIAILAIALMFVNACGRVMLTAPSSGDVMSEHEALQVLQDVPLTDERAAFGKKNYSLQQLHQLILQLIAQGKIKVPNGARSATGGVDLSGLNNIFSLLQGGNVTSLLGLAQGLVNLNSGNASGTKFNLDTILQILQQALPLIMAIAPQFAPILQALLVIIPLVMTFISLFKKPKAENLILVPVWA